ncbi:MAG: hypothetical protein M3R27_16870, partial [Bacteroidota bacterium]|nr:hypothetical protein [Bacteroidota bacterium]
MKHVNFALLSAVLMLSANAFAQKVTITKGGQASVVQKSGSDAINLMVNGDHYFFTEYTERGTVSYDMQSFDSKGSSIADTKLELNPGVFNNTYSIDQVIGVGNKLYAMIEHLDKAGAKNTLLAREIDNSGKISTSEVEVMSIPFEKIMNSGFNYSAASNDQKTLAVLAEYPFVKEEPAKFKIALFDKDLKKTKEGEITLPGENSKNKNMTAVVANDGTVYLIKKKLTKKGDITITVYQWSAGDASPKEYIVEVTAPNQILNYAYEVNSN